MYDRLVEKEKEQREVEAKMLKEVELLTAARDRAMDAQENNVELSEEDARKSLDKAMEALSLHQKKLRNMQTNLQDVMHKMHGSQTPPAAQKTRTRIPLSLFETLSGKPQTHLHSAEVKELFAHANKAGEEHESLSEEDVLKTLIVPGVPKEISEEAAKYMMATMDADSDGRISWAESLNFVQEDSKTRASSMETSSLLERQATELSMEVQVEQMKMNATMKMMKLLEEEQAKEDAKKQLREMRWKNMLERQKASLAEREKALKKQQKELNRLDREERWQSLEAQKKQSSFMEKKACEPHDVHAVLSTPSAAHAKCLKLQLGECADVAQVQAPSLLECNEVSNGWQKKCLNERAREAEKCAPAGVNWEALKKGETGSKVAIDNMAIQKLQGWCTLYTSLQQVKAAGYSSTAFLSKPEWAALLDQDATISNDFMTKVRSFVQQTDETVGLLQIDPNDSPNSIAVRADAAGTVLDAMTQLQAMPVPELIKGLEERGVRTSTLEAGLAGVIDLSLLQHSDLATNGLLCSPRRM